MQQSRIWLESRDVKLVFQENFARARRQERPSGEPLDPHKHRVAPLSLSLSPTRMSTRDRSRNAVQSTLSGTRAVAAATIESTTIISLPRLPLCIEWYPLANSVTDCELDPFRPRNSIRAERHREKRPQRNGAQTFEAIGNEAMESERERAGKHINSGFQLSREFQNSSTS